MATNTTNYGFKKPDESDFYDVQDQNNNWDLADGALKELDTPTFEDYTGETEVPATATALENIKSKGKLATLLSNIKAFCKGCITLAMLVNDTATNNSQLPVSSAVTHDLQQQLNVLNTKISGMQIKAFVVPVEIKGNSVVYVNLSTYINSALQGKKFLGIVGYQLNNEFLFAVNMINGGDYSLCVRNTSSNNVSVDINIHILCM